MKTWYEKIYGEPAPTKQSVQLNDTTISIKLPMGVIKEISETRLTIRKVGTVKAKYDYIRSLRQKTA